MLYYLSKIRKTLIEYIVNKRENIVEDAFIREFVENTRIKKDFLVKYVRELTNNSGIAAGYFRMDDSFRRDLSLSEDEYPDLIGKGKK